MRRGRASRERGSSWEGRGLLQVSYTVLDFLFYAPFDTEEGEDYTRGEEAALRKRTFRATCWKH